MNRNRKRLRLLFVVMVAGTSLVAAAGCAGLQRPGAPAAQPAPAELSDIVTALRQQIEETAGTLEGLQGRVAQLEEGISSFTAMSSVHALNRTAVVPEPPPGKVALKLSFQYLPEPLPDQAIQVYVPQPEVSNLWVMESLPKGEPVPRGEAVADNTVFLEPGEGRLIMLAFENPTAAEVGFLALPHQESPGQHQSDTWLTCFCLSFIYSAPAEGAWYRVIRVTVSPDMPAGTQISALWTILTDPAVFPEG
ncbi:MAG: hypothetical protein ACE5JP_09115 [Candidatus Bipolaricaulia bacterium]